MQWYILISVAYVSKHLFWFLFIRLFTIIVVIVFHILYNDFWLSYYCKLNAVCIKPSNLK